VLSLPGGWSPSSPLARRRTTTPCYPDSINRADTLRRALVIRSGSRLRTASAFVVSLSSDSLAITEVREGVLPAHRVEPLA
jgi:hypothetical protein